MYEADKKKVVCLCDRLNLSAVVKRVTVEWICVKYDVLSLSGHTLSKYIH